MTCGNCGAERDPAVPVCANCGTTQPTQSTQTKSSTGASILGSLALAFVGVFVGIIVGLAIGFFGALIISVGQGSVWKNFSLVPYSVPIAIGAQVLVVLAIAAGAVRAFSKKAVQLGWLLVGIVLGTIGPVGACSAIFLTSGKTGPH